MAVQKPRPTGGEAEEEGPVRALVAATTVAPDPVPAQGLAPGPGDIPDPDLAPGPDPGVAAEARVGPVRPLGGSPARALAAKMTTPRMAHAPGPEIETESPGVLATET